MASSIGERVSAAMEPISSSTNSNVSDEIHQNKASREDATEGIASVVNNCTREHFGGTDVKAGASRSDETAETEQNATSGGGTMLEGVLLKVGALSAPVAVLHQKHQEEQLEQHQQRLEQWAREDKDKLQNQLRLAGDSQRTIGVPFLPQPPPPSPSSPIVQKVSVSGNPSPLDQRPRRRRSSGIRLPASYVLKAGSNGGVDVHEPESSPKQPVKQSQKLSRFNRGSGSSGTDKNGSIAGRPDGLLEGWGGAGPTKDAQGMAPQSPPASLEQQQQMKHPQQGKERGDAEGEDMDLVVAAAAAAAAFARQSPVSARTSLTTAHISSSTFDESTGSSTRGFPSLPSIFGGVTNEEGAEVKRVAEELAARNDVNSSPKPPRKTRRSPRPSGAKANDSAPTAEPSRPRANTGGFGGRLFSGIMRRGNASLQSEVPSHVSQSPIKSTSLSPVKRKDKLVPPAAALAEVEPAGGDVDLSGAEDEVEGPRRDHSQKSLEVLTPPLGNRPSWRQSFRRSSVSDAPPLPIAVSPAIRRRGSSAGADGGASLEAARQESLSRLPVGTTDDEAERARIRTTLVDATVRSRDELRMIIAAEGGTAAAKHATNIDSNGRAQKQLESGGVLREREPSTDAASNKTASTGANVGPVDEELIILHHMFQSFCVPHPTLGAIKSILELERNRTNGTGTATTGKTSGETPVAAATNHGVRGGNNNALPRDAMISIFPNFDKGQVEDPPTPSSSVTKLLCASPPKDNILSLPYPFIMAFFRILIRLLTNESDEEYDEECLFCAVNIDDYADDADESRTRYAFGESDPGHSHGRTGVQNTTTVVEEGDLGYTASLRRIQSDGDRMPLRRQGLNLAREFDLLEEASDTFDDETVDSRSGRSTSTVSVSSGSSSEFLRAATAATKDDNNKRAARRLRWRGGEDKDGSEKKKEEKKFKSSKSAAGKIDALRTKRRMLESMQKRQMWIRSNTNYRFATSQRMKTEKSNRVHSVVRFRCSAERFGNSDCGIVGALLAIVDALLSSSLEEVPINACNRIDLLAPVSRLIGLACIAGISPKHLRRMLSLIHHPSEHSLPKTSNRTKFQVPGLARLYLVRALTDAAEGASQSTRLLGKASPRSFFTFGHGPGLVRKMTSPAPTGTTMTLGGSSVWPFKTDFGMACWFRADRFYDPLSTSSSSLNRNKNPVLLSIRTDDGAGIEVALEVYLSSPSTVRGSSGGSAASLVVTVYDSPSSSDAARPQPQSVRLTGCVLCPRVWYHVAVRHTRPRLKGYLTLAIKDEVSIFLDGKLMHSEPLRFPRISNSSESHDLRPGLLRGGSSSQGSKRNPLTLTFGAHFDGQAGALYIFNEFVSDATLKSLIEVTSGTLSVSTVFGNRGSTNRTAIVRPLDSAWDSTRAELAQRTNAVDMMPIDPEEIVVGSAGVLSLSGRSIAVSTASTSTLSVLDLVEDEDRQGDETSAPTAELSSSALGSRLYLVWDPSRAFQNGFVVEAHSGAHVVQKDGSVHSWCVSGVKDVIGSIGGVQSLLPVFRELLSGKVESGCDDMLEGAEDDGDNDDHSRVFARLEAETNGIYARLRLMIPSLLALLSAFLRDHSDNAREMLRCGGIEIIEQALMRNKLTERTKADGQKEGDNVRSSLALQQRKWSLTTCLRLSRAIAKELVEVLLDLRVASSHNMALESKIYARLLFNIPLWFGGTSDLPGVSLYSVLLPVLSATAKSNPNKLRDCVGVQDMFDAVREYTSICDSEEKKVQFVNEAKTARFDRSTGSGLPLDAPLTKSELRHVIDVILGIVVLQLSSKASSGHIAPLLHFLSFHLDDEFEVRSSESSGDLDAAGIVGTRRERVVAARKTCAILAYLMYQRPLVPKLFESLRECCTNDDGVASWILCCMVNTYDDSIRSLGVRCLTSFLEVVVPSAHSVKAAPKSLESASQDGKKKENMLSNTTPKGAATTITKSLKYVGSLGVIGNGGVLSGILAFNKVNAKIIYKLLWHLMKCHRERLGEDSHGALIDLLLDDGPSGIQPRPGKLDIVIPDRVIAGGYCLHEEGASFPFSDKGFDTSHTIRNVLAMNTLMRLLRFFPIAMKERWMFDLLSLMRMSPPSVEIVLPSRDWQPCLFHLVSEIVEEINAKQNGDRLGEENAGSRKSSSEQGEQSKSDNNRELTLARPTRRDSLEVSPVVSTKASSLETRFDLGLKLYSTLLGDAIRLGGDKGVHALEQAASLQRMCMNGHEVFSIVLSHLLAELIENGTVVCSPNGQNTPEKPSKASSALKQSASIFFMDGPDGMAAAVRQWRCLRHLTAIAVAVITASGYGVVDLFDYRNQNASAIDEQSGGLHGIRLPDGPVSGVAAADAIANGRSTSLEDSQRRKTERESFRLVCVTISSQVLTLLDAFIFPDSVDSSSPPSQLHGLALVRSTEPRLGQAQGPLLASLLRLSLVLLSHLEPSSVKFLQCCSRLRCFVHWTLELVRESASTSGASSPFSEQTGQLDRLLLAVVIQCHRALSRCSAVLIEMESSPVERYFSNAELKQKNYRRLFRAVFETREIVVAAFRGRNEVLRSALSPQSFDALRAGLEDSSKLLDKKAKNGGIKSKEASLRAFMASRWVTGFHDVEMVGDVVLPEQLGQGHGTRHRTPNKMGRKAGEDLAAESKSIVGDYHRGLNAPFEAYCEDQRQWADTDAVRELEYNGDLTVKKFAENYQQNIMESGRRALLRAEAANQRWSVVDRKVSEPWTRGRHWKLASYTDRLHRRILFVQNRNFDSHEDASYEKMLSREREKAMKEREDRLRKIRLERNAAKKSAALENGIEDDPEEDDDDTDIAAIVKQASKGIVPLSEMMADDENEDSDDDITLEPEFPDRDDNSIADISLIPGSVESEQVSEAVPVAPLKEEKEDGAQNTHKDGAFAWTKEFIWSRGEQIVQSFESVVVVSLQSTTEGELLLTSHSLYFRPTGEQVNVMTKKEVNQSSLDEAAKLASERKNRRWRLNRLTEVHGRRHMLRAQALELFFADTFELFINFNGGTKERDKFYFKLRNSCKVPMLCSPRSLAPRTVFSKSNLTDLWRRRKMSNFEYLMHLNIMAGRTFNDITQYPVFPWVLSDYTSSTLDLKDPSVYRDLSKPVGALNPARLDALIERYNDLDGFPEEEKFLYGSHYSSPGVVLHFLIRQEPFTTMAVDLQSGRFDCPDRLFFDVEGCWRSCLTSTSDVKELTPEFFTCPEIFVNTNSYPLGQTQSGVAIDHVKLPPWAKGSPHEFVRLHKLALESEYVSKNLHLWVDLIFGYKQRGPEAVRAHNLFHHLSYEGAVDLDKITDEVDRRATESHIQNFGQTPSQLLVKEPHPRRMPLADCWQPMFLELSHLRRLRCHTPQKQFGGSAESEARGPVVSLTVLSDTVVALYSDLSVGTYRWSQGRSVNSSSYLKMDRMRSLGCRSMSRSVAAVNAGVLSGASAADTSVSPNARDMDVSGLGNQSCAMCLGGSIAENRRRKVASGPSRPMESSTNMGDSAYLMLTCGYWDDTVKAHSIDNLRLRGSESGGHRGRINCLSVGEDGGLLVTGGQDATCRVWVVDHHEMSAALTDGYVQTALGKNSDMSESRLLSCVHVLWGHESAITSLAVSSDLDVVVSGDADGVICVHTMRQGEFVRSIRADSFGSQDGDVHGGSAGGTGFGVRCLALDSNGTFVAHMENGMLQMYTVNGVELRTTNAMEKLNAMYIGFKCQVLVTGGDEGHVILRSIEDFSVRQCIDLSSHGPIRSIALTPYDSSSSSQAMYVGSNDGKISIVERDSSTSSPGGSSASAQFVVEEDEVIQDLPWVAAGEI